MNPKAQLGEGVVVGPGSVIGPEVEIGANTVIGPNAVLDGKVSVSVGITNDLTKKFDAVELVKIAASILGGKGGGGRPDFAQAGGIDSSKIDNAIEQIKSLI